MFHAEDEPGGEPGASDWFELPADDTAPGIARGTARRLVGRWAVGAVVEPLMLIVSELVANAVRHGHPPIRLLLQRVGRGVRVDVHDEAPLAGPMKGLNERVRLPSAKAQGGRGLFLVHALSAEHGVEHIPDDGKRIWAVVEPEQPGSHRAEPSPGEDSPPA
jgi:anti-sigma regulatory factor (Ser/Thr protein kinase)